MKILVVGDELKPEIVRLAARYASQGIAFEILPNPDLLTDRIIQGADRVRGVISSLLLPDKVSGLCLAGVDIALACRLRRVPAQIVYRRDQHDAEKKAIIASLAHNKLPLLDCFSPITDSGWDLEPALAHLLTGILPPRRPMPHAA